MAIPTAQVSQSALEFLAGVNSTARVAQSVLEFIITPGSPPPPVIAGPTPIGGGAPYAVRLAGGCSPKRTRYDFCLEQEARDYRRTRPQPPCGVPREYRNLLPWDDDRSTPPQAVPFRVTGSLVTPAPAAGNQVIVSRLIPTGFDALLSGIFFGYSGTGFTQGSGDIIWRVRLNQRWVKDLSAVPFILGSPVSPLPLTEGQPLLSGNLLSAIVEVPNLSGLIQVNQSTVYAGLLGFLWPQ